MAEELIRVEDLWKAYPMGEGRVEVLEALDLTVRRGELILVTGVSGVGKSTLLNILGLMDFPDRGGYFFEGEDFLRLDIKEKAKARSGKISFIFQYHHLIPEFDILDNVLLPLWIGGKGQSGRSREKAVALLGSLGLADRIRHKPSQLSAGELQRAAIARAFIKEAPLVLADEPTGNLDPKTGGSVFESFLKLQRESGLTSVIVTHNIALAEKCSRIFELRSGRLYEIKTGGRRI